MLRSAGLGLAKAPVKHLILPGLGGTAGRSSATLAAVLKLHTGFLAELLLEQLDRLVFGGWSFDLHLPSSSIPAPMLHEPVLGLVTGLHHLHLVELVMVLGRVYQVQVGVIGLPTLLEHAAFGSEARGGNDGDAPGFAFQARLGDALGGRLGLRLCLRCHGGSTDNWQRRLRA